MPPKYDDWTHDKTISKPTVITVQYTLEDSGDKREVQLQSTGWSETTSEYKTVQYLDRQGQLQQEDLLLEQETIDRSTAAAVNGVYVSWRLGKELGLPDGDALRRNHTAYSYWVDQNGARKTGEIAVEWISGFELAGSLNIEDYTGFVPTAELIRTQETFTEYTEATTSDGRSYTRTKVTRYIAMGLTQEGQQSAKKQLQDDDGDGVITNKVFYAMQALVCDGTEIRVSQGRLPLPTRPDETELVKDDLTNPDNDPWVRDNYDGASGIAYTNDLPNIDALIDSFGDGIDDADKFKLDFTYDDKPNLTLDTNNDGVPDWVDNISSDWPDLATQDSNGDGVPDWATFVPSNWQDYATDTNNSGFPDWVDYVTDNWASLSDQDSDGNGVPDWLDLLSGGTAIGGDGDTDNFDMPFAPDDSYTQWQDFLDINPQTGRPFWTDAISDNWTDFDDLDSNGDGFPDWADLTPGGWEDYSVDVNGDGRPDWLDWITNNSAILTNQDSNGDGMPDWADLMPGDWQDYANDADNNGKPDWIDYLENNWQSVTNQDSNGDGVPDWAALTPSGWEVYANDQNNNGKPDWVDYISANWQSVANQDSNNDGVPDWATLVPGNWQDYAGDSNNNSKPDWVDYISANWQSVTNQDSNGDGVPDWADLVPTGWGYFANDADGNGLPEWVDYVTDNWETLATQDSNNDGVPDWAAFMPTDFVDGGAEAAAYSYAIAVNSLKAGYAYGFNVSTSADQLPSDPFSPLFINAAGMSVALRTNGTSWAFGDGGIVVASDLMLCGVAGVTESVSNSWVRIPVNPNNLPVLDPPQINNSPAPANSIAAPEDFDPKAPGNIFAALPRTGVDVPIATQSVSAVVTPSVVREERQGRSRHRAILLEYPYRLELSSDNVEALSRHRAEVAYGAAPPLIEGTLTLETPSLSAGVSIEVGESMNAAAPAPSVGTGFAALVPEVQALTLSTGLSLDAGGPAVRIFVDPAPLGLTPAAPLITGGTSNAVPVSAAALTAPAPKNNYSLEILTGTAAPVLGAAGAGSYSGWTLRQNGNVDDDWVTFTGFGFDFKLANTTYTGCFIGSNGYVTFGSGSSNYSSISVSNPPYPKILWAGGDRSYQRVFTRTGSNSSGDLYAQFRWEGSSGTAGTVGSPSIVIEITFWSPRGDGSQWIDMRYGVLDIATTLTIANASSAYASGTAAANSSWVAAGNAAGTSWTLTSDRYVALV